MTRKEFAVAVTILCSALLIGCDNKSEPPVVGHGTRADSADQVMFKARFNLTDNGLARAELTADSALFFEDNTRVELKTIATTFFTITGARDAYLTALRGTYLSRLGNMIARDSVIVVTEEGRRLETAELKYDQALNQISSDSAFVLTEPGRRLAGVGFRSDPNMQNVQILKTKSGSTGAIQLPGQ